MSIFFLQTSLRLKAIFVHFLKEWEMPKSCKWQFYQYFPYCLHPILTCVVFSPLPDIAMLSALSSLGMVAILSSSSTWSTCRDRGKYLQRAGSLATQCIFLETKQRVHRSDRPSLLKMFRRISVGRISISGNCRQNCSAI